MTSLVKTLALGMLVLLLESCAAGTLYHTDKQANTAYQQTDYMTALDKWQAALEQARHLEDQHAIAQFLYNIGLAYDKLGQYQNALEAYQQALDMQQHAGNTSKAANILNNMGIIYDKLGQYQHALETYRQALELRQQVNDRPGEARTLNNLGIVYYRLGQYTKTLEMYQRALAMKRELADQQGEANTLDNMAAIYESRGQYHLALDAYQQTLALRRHLKDTHGEGGTLNNLGVVFWKLGEYRQALAYYQQALTIRRELHDNRGEAKHLNNIGVVFWKMGQYQEALTYYDQALSIRQSIGDKQGEASTLNNIGNVYESLQQYERALQFYRDALAIRQKIGDKRGEGIALNDIGRLYHHLGQYQQAYNVFQASLAIHDSLGTIDELWIAQSGLAATEVRLKQPEAAITHYEQALDNIETLRAGLAPNDERISFMQEKLYVYDELLELLQGLHQTSPHHGYDRKAFEIFERKQGRVFLEEMGKSGARLFAGLPETVKQQEEQFDTQADQLHQQLIEERTKSLPDPKRLHQLEEQERALHIQRKAFQEALRVEFPDYYALRYPQPVDLAALQHQVLESGEVMCVYSVLNNSTLLWVIQPEGLEMHVLPVGEQTLQEKVRELRDIMADEWGKTRGLEIVLDNNRSAGSGFIRKSYELYTLLVPQAVRNVLNRAHLVDIVPTGPLYDVPFEALSTRAQTPAYVVEAVPVSYLSSASLLKTLRQVNNSSRSAPPYPLLAFAHPVYALDAVQEPTSSVRTLRNQSYREMLGGELTELPETAEEATAIASLFDAPVEADPLQLRWDASRARVFSLNRAGHLDDYQYLLFAMHGILPGEVDSIKQSALILSDDVLTMADVFQLRLNARLVSLSACNTGRGQGIRGEGVIGLTRAFMYAGSPAVAVTLWAIESLSAKALSIGMFRALKDGDSPARALQTIKIQMLRGDEGEDYRHPYYWAPFVVFGDGK